MRRTNAFTLIELLVVVLIISLLMSILLPVLGKSRDAAKDLICKSNLKMHGLAFMLYATDYDDEIPYHSEGVPGQWTMESGGTSNDPRRGGGKLWYELLVEHGAAYDGFDSDIGNHNDPRKGVWRCPMVDNTDIESVHATSTSLASWGGGYGVASNVIGYNSGSSIWADGSPPISTVRSPTTLMLVGDTGRSKFGFSHPDAPEFQYVTWMRASNPPYMWRQMRSDQVAARHDKKANITFFDGHTASVAYASIQVNDGDLFGLNDPNVTDRRN